MSWWAPARTASGVGFLMRNPALRRGRRQVGSQRGAFTSFRASGASWKGREPCARDPWGFGFPSRRIPPRTADTRSLRGPGAGPRSRGSSDSSPLPFPMALPSPPPRSHFTGRLPQSYKSIPVNAIQRRGFSIACPFRRTTSIALLLIPLTCHPGVASSP